MCHCFLNFSKYMCVKIHDRATISVMLYAHITDMSNMSNRRGARKTQGL